MKRVRRWLLNIAATLSLLLCVAMLGLWVRSYWVSDNINFPPIHYRMLQSNRGEVTYSSTQRPGAAPVPGWEYKKHDAFISASMRALQADPGTRVDFQLAGFSWFWTEGGTVNNPPRGSIATVTMWTLFPRWSVGIPHWFAAVLFAIIPIYRLMRRPAYPPGHCRRCGYDMRETPQRCPECGSPAEPSAPAATNTSDQQVQQ